MLVTFFLQVSRTRFILKLIFAFIFCNFILDRDRETCLPHACMVGFHVIIHKYLHKFLLITQGLYLDSLQENSISFHKRCSW